ncbi:AraC family transcriptional regulator [Mycolicibacterium llatzerense]|uniref:AraC family transcriptional regulator n=1 Tax=Mycolicibacterium llatzerense TaxID=280871 RepID=UPI0008DCD1DB|nr:AraC family transcriptional regulator [Mycolicibacterium llatzerense]
MSVIRGTALTNFCELVAESGGDSHALLEDAHIPLDDVGHQDRFISLPNGARLLEDAAAALEVPDFGRRLAQRQDISILGAVGLAARNATTVADSFAIFDKFMAAYSPAISARMTVPVGADLRRFEFEYKLNPAPPQAQAIELSLGVTLQVLRLFLGADYRPLTVHLPHAARTPADDYQLYFGCPPVFGEPVAGFTLRATDLQRPLPTDRIAHQTAVAHLTSTIGESEPDTTQLVRSLIRQLLPTGAVNLPDIARHIGLHPRALQRRLATEDIVFTDLVDQTRREVAQRLLLDTNVSLDQLCRHLGYAEQSVLTRSCRRWFNMTPTAYRAAGGRQR